MTQTTGPNKLGTFSDKLTNIDTRITELYTKFGIDKSVFQLDANSPREECENIALYLAKLSYELQLESNRLCAKYNFSNTILNRTAYPLTEQYVGSWEARFWKAIKENIYAKTINDEMIVIKVDIDAINYISKRIEQFIEILLQIVRGKK